MDEFRPSIISPTRLLFVATTILFLTCAAVDASVNQFLDEESIADLLEQPPGEIERAVDLLIFMGQLETARDILDAALQAHPYHQGLKESDVWLGSLEQESSDPEAAALERRIDSLIMQFRFGEAQSLIDEGLQAFPGHAGIMASESMIGFMRMIAWAGIAMVAMIVVVAVAIWMLLWRRRQVGAAAVFVTAVYIFCIPLAILLGLFGGGVINLDGTGDALPFANYRHHFLLAVSAFLGAVGGAINCSFMLTRIDARREGSQLRFLEVFFRPLNGFFLAAVMYLALLAGKLALFGGSFGGTATEFADTATPSVWSIGLLAVLTGLFSENAITKLRQLSDTLFGMTRTEPEGHREPRRRVVETPAEIRRRMADAAGGDGPVEVTPESRNPGPEEDRDVRDDVKS